MTRRGYGRQTWEAPAATPPEIADAVHRIVDLWADRIEGARAGGRGTVPFSQTAGKRGQSPRYDHTTRRCRAVAAVLRGLAGRQQVTEEQLADAIEGYAESDWHRRQRAWRTLTDWLAPEREDELLRWVVDGRAAARRREAAAERRIVQAAEREVAQAGLAHEADLAARARQRLDALIATESDELEAMERAALAALPEPTAATLFRAAGRPECLTVANSPGLRGLVLAEIRRRMEG